MFEYIGRKIKVLAKVLFWMSVIGSSVLGVLGVIIYVAEGEAYAAIGVLFVALFYCLLSVIWSWLVYGLGQLIDNTDKLVAFKQEEKDNAGDINNNYTNLQ